ncbi:MAG: PmoA family protein, partial [Chloroflexota bacterium]|nr:PmoA family protein [Chloroflexota bacterium]
FPLIGPTGASMVRNWPMVEGIEGETNDHPHHKGLYVAHGDVNGTDHWSEGANHSTMRHAGFSRLVSGPVYGSFDETVEWLDREARIVLTETRRVTFFNLRGNDRLGGHGRLGGEDKILDVSLRFSASSGTVTFGDTKEGGLLSIRLASSMDGPTKSRPDGAGQMENSYGGRQEEECWGKRAMWCDYCGPLEGEIVGVCLMDHPTNPRYPTHWHVRAYGLMTANPFGLHDFYNDSDTHRGDWTIPAYESRNFHYRVLLHRGSTDTAGVRERYHDFVNIPSVQLV